MPAPPDPSHSASERRRSRPGGGDGMEGSAAGADRFWQEFSQARPDRPRRDGGREEERRRSESREEQTAEHECLEWCPICRSADVVRAAGGPEVRNQIASLQRDSLLALRTLIDAYLARAAPPAQAPWDEPAPGRPDPPVQDIPLD